MASAASGLPRLSPVAPRLCCSAVCRDQLLRIAAERDSFAEALAALSGGSSAGQVSAVAAALASPGRTSEAVCIDLVESPIGETLSALLHPPLPSPHPPPEPSEESPQCYDYCGECIEDEGAHCLPDSPPPNPMAAARSFVSSRRARSKRVVFSPCVADSDGEAAPTAIEPATPQPHSPMVLTTSPASEPERAELAAAAELSAQLAAEATKSAAAAEPQPDQVSYSLVRTVIVWG